MLAADRLRYSAVTAVCVLAAVLLAAVGAPGTALAVTCKNPTTASGSSLQGKQQETWKTEFKKEKGLECKAEVEVNYTSTGSGQGLEEFGIPGGVLKPEKSGNGKTLDAFIGTDDPPTEPELKEAEKASGSAALTAPIVSAPVAVIVNLPEKCTAEEPAEVHVTQAALNEGWKTEKTWGELLEKWGYKKPTGEGCKEKVKHEVRFDSSGTSFAFKYFLCQIEAGGEKSETKKCPTWEEKAEILTDKPVWPAAIKAETEHKNSKKETVPNKSSSGEIAGVAETRGSIGYVNYANARTEPTGEAFKAFAKGATKFWVQLETNGSKFAEPGKGTEGKEGNCTSGLTTEQKEGLPAEKVALPVWSKFHLSAIAPNTSGAYPLCTLTYDIAWENYSTTTLEGEKAYKSKAGAEENGNSAKEYLSYALAGTKGQAHIAEGYSALPTEVRSRAAEAQKKVKN